MKKAKTLVLTIIFVVLALASPCLCACSEEHDANANAIFVTQKSECTIAAPHVGGYSYFQRSHNSIKSSPALADAGTDNTGASSSLGSFSLFQRTTVSGMMQEMTNGLADHAIRLQLCSSHGDCKVCFVTVLVVCTLILCCVAYALSEDDDSASSLYPFGYRDGQISKAGYVEDAPDQGLSFVQGGKKKMPGRPVQQSSAPWPQDSGAFGSGDLAPDPGQDVVTSGDSGPGLPSYRQDGKRFRPNAPPVGAQIPDGSSPGFGPPAPAPFSLWPFGARKAVPNGPRHKGAGPPIHKGPKAASLMVPDGETWQLTMPFVESKGTKIGSHGTFHLKKVDDGKEVAVIKLKMPDWSHTGKQPCFEITTPQLQLVAKGVFNGGSHHKHRSVCVYDAEDTLFSQVRHDPHDESHNVYVLAGQTYGFSGCKLEGGPWQFHGDFNGHVIRVIHENEEVGIFEPTKAHNMFQITLHEGVDIGLAITGLVSIYILEIGGLHRYGFAHL